MGKPTICIGENKDAHQLRSNCEADQRLCFRYTDSTIPLLSKSKIFQPLAICDCTGRFISDLVENPICWFSHAQAHFMFLWLLMNSVLKPKVGSLRRTTSSRMNASCLFRNKYRNPELEMYASGNAKNTPLTSHFYIIKLGFAGINLFFLFLIQNIDCGYSLEPPSRVNVLNENKQYVEIFLLKIIIFSNFKYLCILHWQVFAMLSEPSHEKTNNLGFRLGLTQTSGLYSHRSRLESRHFGLKKKRNCSICLAKTKALISFAVTAKLICAFVFAYANVGFLMQRLKYLNSFQTGQLL